MWARVKEAAKRGKQKLRMGDLLADEVQPSGARLLAVHLCRASGATSGGELGQRGGGGGGGGGGDGRGGGARGVVTCGPLACS